MEYDIFKEIKQLVSIEDLVEHVLGEADYESGSELYWFSQTHDEETASLGANKEKQIISDFSDESFGKGLDIFSFLVSLNNHPNSYKKYFIAEKTINNWDALLWIVKEFHLDIDVSSYTKLSVPKASCSNQTNLATSIEYSLEVTEPKYIKDNYIYTMFDSVCFREKPDKPQIGQIKNRIPKLEAGAYTLEMIKDKLISGFTCIPSALKSETDWIDDESFYQIFMVDVDNTIAENSKKINLSVNDENHITVDKILEYCKSINLVPTFIYYTLSHSEEQHKFRLVYILDLVTSKKSAVKGVYEFLKKVFKNYNMDNSPTSVSSLFLGGKALAFESENYYSIKETNIEKTEIIEETPANVLAKTCNSYLNFSPYLVKNGKLWYTAKKDVFAPISNFVTYASEKINFINGRDTETKYIMNCHLLDQPELELPDISIDVESYSKCNFIMGSCWDKHAIISAGRSNSDRLREVMQILGRYVTTEKNIYAHTGFRRIDGKLCFLYHSGIIGDAENVSVDLSNDNLQQYCFTDKSFDVIQALQRSLSFLDVADYSITIPILSTIYLAPLTSILAKHNIPADFLLFIQGKSGTRKSSLSALALSHFGKFNRDNFPASFRDTLNSIEKKAYILKNVVSVVDDFNPEVIGNRKLDTMERLYAMYGDRVGRTRMSQDGKTLKQPYVARGLCIVTGEMLPDVAQSRIARSLVVTIKEDSIDLNKLSILQNNAEELAYSMMKYIEWIIHNEENIVKKVKSQFNQLRGQTTQDVHGRTSEISAVLTIGITLFTQFLYENGSINIEKKQNLDLQASNVLNELVKQQTQEVTELKPSQMFYDALEQLLSTHTVSVEVINREGYYGFGSRFDDFSAQGKNVGYYDCKARRYYLFPDAIFNEIDRFYSANGNKKFPVNARTLWRYLAEEGYLYQNDKSRYKVAKKINKKTVYVIDIKARKILDDEITAIIDSSKTPTGFNSSSMFLNNRTF